MDAVEIVRIVAAAVIGAVLVGMLVLYRWVRYVNRRQRAFEQEIRSEVRTLRETAARERIAGIRGSVGDGEPGSPDTSQPTHRKPRLGLIIGGGGLAAAAWGKVQHGFQVHTVGMVSATAAAASLGAAAILWGAGVIDLKGGEDRPDAAQSAPHTPGEGTIPPTAAPSPSPTESQTPAGPSPTSSPTGSADTGPAGEPGPTEPAAANELTADGDIGSAVPGTAGGSGEQPTDGTPGGSESGGSDGGTGGDEPPPDGDTGGTSEGTDGGTDAGDTASGGGDPPAEPSEAEGLVCVGLTLPPLLDIDRLCLL